MVTGPVINAMCYCVIEILGTTDIPTRNCLSAGWFASKLILTGKRCTILVKFPVALCAPMAE